MTDSADRLKELWAANARIGRSAEYAQMMTELEVWDKRALRAGLWNAGWFAVVAGYGYLARTPSGSIRQDIFWVGLAGVIVLSLRFVTVQVGRAQWLARRIKRLMREDRATRNSGSSVS
jgi:hypothetical protein